MRNSKRSTASKRRTLSWAVTVTVALMGVLAPTASAAVPFEILNFEHGHFKADGTPATQAGEHPYAVTTSFAFPSEEKPNGLLPAENPKEIEVELPAGFTGDVSEIPTCSEEELGNTSVIPGTACPDGSQVGEITLYVTFNDPVTTGIYNMQPTPGVPATFGARIATLNIHVRGTLRPRPNGDYGVIMHIRNASQGLPLFRSDTTFWGVPADPAHDAVRGECYFEGGSCPSAAPREPSLSNPTSCTAEPLTARLRVTTWQSPDVLHTASDEMPPMEGCEKLEFDPEFVVRPDSRRADAPTGLEVELKMADDLNPEGLAPSHLKAAKVVLPEGMTVNPAMADGLNACSPAQIGLGSEAPPSCPPSSKIGEVEVESPLINGTMPGHVYLAEQGSNPFGSLLALYMVIDAPGKGVLVKIPGRISLDQGSGRMTTTFERNPQLPFTSLWMRFNGGDRAPLVSPRACGLYTIAAELSPWARPAEVVSRKSSFLIDQGCERSSRFTPGFEGGTRSSVAGKFSPFLLRITREDGQPNISALSATLPEGLLAKLAGVAVCPDAFAVSGACPAQSRVGNVVAGVGAGANPLFVPQPGKALTALYLAGPYKGAPYSLVAKIPAQAGPFDLGTVAVRNALRIDPVTAQVTATSDPLPQILEGIPISYRDVRVEVDRPEFTLNPTSCEPMAISARIGSTAGVASEASDRFRAVDCERLGFAPKLSLRLKGKTHRSAHPALTATLTARNGDANIGRAVVTLPKTQFLEQSHIRTICTRAQYAAESCPKASVYGYAKAWTPLLDKPLQGPVYLRSSSNTLPDLVADLDGQISIDLAGRIDSVNSRMRATFGAVPDAPVSKFVLKMQGGRKGLLVNNTELCEAKPRAKAAFTGQNGKRSITNPLVKVGCGKGGKRSK
jgi:hypothetical protein